MKWWNVRFAETEALHTLSPRGYLTGKIFGVSYFAHRIIWVMSHGRWPVAEIDHINHVKTDNRLSNLREATRSQNMVNRGGLPNTSSQFCGVHWNRKNAKWRSVITIGGKHRSLGYFHDEREAAKAYDIEAEKLGGQFAFKNFRGEST